jgi:hypothetical protein
VQEVLAVLERAMVAAAKRDGHVMQTVALLWSSEKDGETFGGSQIKGDVSGDMIEFLTEILQDDTEDVPVPNPLGRVQ